MTQDPVVIVAAARTPIGSFQGCFKNLTAPQLGAAAIAALLERSRLAPETIDEVLMGCVLTAGLGQAPARQAALAAGLSTATPCTTISKVCGSGMKTVMLAHDSLIANSANIMIAGGMESMSRAPYLLPKARAGYRLGHQKVLDHMFYDGLEDAYDQGRLMGEFAEECAQSYGFDREIQDSFARESILRAKKATENGSFMSEITPIKVSDKQINDEITQDEGVIHAKPDKIAQLKPAFKDNGTVTAANASSISDGAAALMLMRFSQARQLNLNPMAVIVGHSSHAEPPYAFTTAPIGAIQKLLSKINWSLHDVDLFEINEAFAVVALAAMKTLQLPRDKVNIHGGACVLGHPIGASGTRLLVTLLYALKQYNLRRGIASLCIGGGEATAVAIELY